MTTSCPNCGAEVVLDIAAVGEGTFARRLARIQVLCEACSEELDRREEKQRAEEKLERRITAADMPRQLRGQDFAGFVHPNAEAAAREWAVSGGGLYLHGPVGVGKTRLAAAACWARLQERPVRWISAPRLFAQARMSFAEDSHDQALQLVAGRGAIVLDDLDKGSPTDFGRELIFTCVDERIESGAPLLVTSNLPLSALGDRFGEWIASRLAGYCSVFEMDGADRRLDRLAVRAA